jgi:aryl-alcohol dehydrogenase-like predicted oxidoreductase
VVLSVLEIHDKIAEMMEYRKLGKSGPNVSRIGLGCMSLSGNREQDGIDIIHRAIARGINFIDTADLYEKGLNETLVGKALKEKRREVVLATKVGNQWRADGSGWDWNPRRAHILAAVDESLRRLGTDYIDLYQLHGGTIDDPIDETIDAFEILQRAGKILHYGISSIRPNVIREYVKRSRITSVMMQYSLLDRRPEESVLELLQSNGIGVLARGPLAQGLLVDKPAKEYLGNPVESVNAARAAVHACARAQRSASQVSLQFVLHHPAVTAAVGGARTMAQLEDITGVFQAPGLTEAEYQSLRQVIDPNRYTDHR